MLRHGDSYVTAIENVYSHSHRIRRRRQIRRHRRYRRKNTKKSHLRQRRQRRSVRKKALRKLLPGYTIHHEPLNISTTQDIRRVLYPFLFNHYLQEMLSMQEDPISYIINYLTVMGAIPKNSLSNIYDTKEHQPKLQTMEKHISISDYCTRNTSSTWIPFIRHLLLEEPDI